MHIDEWLSGLAEQEKEKQAALELEALFDHLPMEDVVKIAASDKKDVQPSWWAGQKAQTRAMRAGDKGLKKYVASDELVGKRYKGLLGGGVLGGLGGAALGSLSNAPGSKTLGALVGAGLGAGVGAGRADKKYLESKGIKQRWGGLASPHMTEEAAKKYLKKDEGRRKVAFVENVARQIAHEQEKVAVLGGALIGAGAGALHAKARDKKVGKGAAKGALIGGAADLGAGIGMIPGALAGKPGLAALGALGGGIAGGVGTHKLLKDKEKGKKKKASVSFEAIEKAKIASRAMRANQGAPPHVAQAAIEMAGRGMYEVEKLAEEQRSWVKPVAALGAAGSLAGGGYLALRKGRGKRLWRSAKKLIKGPPVEAAKKVAPEEPAKKIVERVRSRGMRTRAPGAVASRGGVRSSRSAFRKRRAVKAEQRARQHVQAAQGRVFSGQHGGMPELGKLSSAIKLAGSGGLMRLQRRLGARAKKLIPLKDVDAGKFIGKADPTKKDPQMKRLWARISQRQEAGRARDFAREALEMAGK